MQHFRYKALFTVLDYATNSLTLANNLGNKNLPFLIPGLTHKPVLPRLVLRLGPWAKPRPPTPAMLAYPPFREATANRALQRHRPRVPDRVAIGEIIFSSPEPLEGGPPS